LIWVKLYKHFFHLFIMGFIRGALLFLVGILLFVSLLAGNTLLTLGLSLNYENVNNELSSVLGELILGDYSGLLDEVDPDISENVDEGFAYLEEYCETNTEFSYSQGEYSLTIPCDVVEQGPEQIINQSIGNAVEDIYYQEYDCEFWSCFGEEGLPFFLISEKAQEYWMNKFYLVLLVSIILSVLVLILVENKRNFPIVLGAFMVVSSLPFMKLNSVIGIFGGEIIQFISVFISEARTVFLIFFMSGLILIGLGFVLHGVKAGFSLAEWIKARKEKMKSFNTLKGTSTSKTPAKKK